MIDFKSTCNCNVDGKKTGFSWVLLMLKLVSPKTLSCCIKGRIRDLLKTDLLLWWHVKEIDRKNNGNSYHLFLYWGRSTTAISKQKSLQKVY